MGETPDALTFEQFLCLMLFVVFVLGGVIDLWRRGGGGR